MTPGSLVDQFKVNKLFMEMGKAQGRAGLGVEIGNLLLGMLSLRCPLDIQGRCQMSN